MTLREYHDTHTTDDLTALIKAYAKEEGYTIRKLDRKTDTSHTYYIHKKEDDDLVECLFFEVPDSKNLIDRFDLHISMEKNDAGGYFLIMTADEHGRWTRCFEYSYGKVIRLEKDTLRDLIERHQKLFLGLSGENLNDLRDQP